VGELLAAITALAPLAAALLERWRVGRPARRRAARDRSVEEDLRGVNDALVGRDAAALAARFERERLAALRRRAARRLAAGLAPVRLRGDGAGDPGDPEPPAA
jgi:hypothetical protein